MARSAPRPGRRFLVTGVGALTLAGLALRLTGIDQSLFGDEIFTYAIVKPGFGHVFSGIHAYERNPPLFFFLAAAAAKLGDPTVWTRMPSLLLGTATIPLTYLIGVRTVGRGAAFLGAALLAASPFAIFYSTEARAYASLTFFVLLSLLALLRALESDGVRWWVLFWAASTAAVYTHYTAVLPLGAEAAWALYAYPARRRRLLIAGVAVALAYVPWLPSLAAQNHPLIGTPLSAESFLGALVRTLAGHPLSFPPERAFYGTPALILLGVSGAAIVGGVLVAAFKSGVRGVRIAPAQLPLVAIALVVPLALLAYSLHGTNLVSPRNLSSALPAACLLLAAVLLSMNRPLAWVAIVTLFVALGIGTAKILGPDWRRPDFKDAAHWVDREARPGDPVVEVPSYLAFGVTFFLSGFAIQHSTPLADDIALNYRRPHERFAIVRFGVASRTVQPLPSPQAWISGAQRGRVFVIGAVPKTLRLPISYVLPRPPGGARRFRLVAERTFSGLYSVKVLVYAPVLTR